MHSKYIGIVKKGILMLLCIVIAVLLAFQSEMNFAKVIVLMMLAYAVVGCKLKRIGNVILLLSGLVLCLYTGRYFVQTVLPIREKYDATRYQQLTQISTAENWENSEMWISPIVNGKTVDLTYAGEWCHKYFEEFAEDIYVKQDGAERTRNISGDIIEKFFFELNEHRFPSTKDFFEDELVREMYNGIITGHLFVAAEDLATSDTVCVMTDDEYNVYLMSEEILEKVLNADEK